LKAGDMPLFIGVPYQPYSFLIKKLDDLIIAQDDKGRVRFSGTDASTVIQSAIDALTNGGKIFIKAGTYTITTSLSIDKHRIIFEGESLETRLKGSGNIDLIKLSFPAGEDVLKRVTIKNMRLENESESVGGNIITSKATIPDGSGKRLYNLKIEGIVFGYTPSGKYALELRNPEWLEVKDCSFSFLASNSGGILIDGESYVAANMLFFKNVFGIGSGETKSNVTFMRLQQTLNAEESEVQRLRILSNHFFALGTVTGSRAIDIYGREASYMRIRDNSFEDKFLNAIKVDGLSTSWRCRDIQILGNKFFDWRTTVETNQCFVQLTANTELCRVAENHFIAKSGSGAVGVEDLNTSYLLRNSIEDNKFKAVDTPIIRQPATIARWNEGFNPRGMISEATLTSGTSYRNREGIDLIVETQALMSPTSVADAILLLEISSDETTWYLADEQRVLAGGPTTLRLTVKAIVPPGWYYRVTTTNATIQHSRRYGN